MILPADFRQGCYRVAWANKPVFLVFVGTRQRPTRIEARTWDEKHYQYLLPRHGLEARQLYRWVKYRSTIVAFAPYYNPIKQADWAAVCAEGLAFVKKLQAREI